MSKLNINRLTNENEDGAPRISGISTFSSTAFFEPPKGTTAQRPEFVQPGMIRFNTDSGHLEYYNGVEWTEVLVANNTLDGGNRGVFFGAAIAPTSPNYADSIDYLTISTLGDSISIDTLSGARGFIAACSSSTRGIAAGGANPTLTSTIEYVTISSTGSRASFGNLIGATYTAGGCANSTRGLLGGGYSPNNSTSTNAIEYITISSTGSNQDFGD